MEKKDEDTQDADELMMHEVVYLNEQKVKPSVFDSEQDTTNIWFLDNGASNHMSGNRTFFATLDERITGRVRFGDDSRIDIKGRGSIRFIFDGGEKKILKDVYYIPGLRSNIISLGQATEAGCEVRMKDKELHLHDRMGHLMVKTTRSPNRLYKVILEADTVQVLQISETTESYKWHSRLGHVNLNTMKLMISKELVTGIPHLDIKTETWCLACAGSKLELRFQKRRYTELLSLSNWFMGISAGQSLLPCQHINGMCLYSLMTSPDTCG